MSLLPWAWYRTLRLCVPLLGRVFSRPWRACECTRYVAAGAAGSEIRQVNRILQGRIKS